MGVSNESMGSTRCHRGDRAGSARRRRGLVPAGPEWAGDGVPHGAGETRRPAGLHQRHRHGGAGGGDRRGRPGGRADHVLRQGRRGARPSITARSSRRERSWPRSTTRSTPPMWPRPRRRSGPAKATLQRAEADLGQLKAKLNQAERDWKRAQKLGPSEALAQASYDAYKSAYETAQANVAVGEAAILQAEAEPRPGRGHSGSGPSATWVTARSSRRSRASSSTAGSTSARPWWPA